LRKKEEKKGKVDGSLDDFDLPGGSLPKIKIISSHVAKTHLSQQFGMELCLPLFNNVINFTLV